MGSKTTWEVTGTAVFENKIWAACVQPVPATKKYYTENPVPIVVLALRKGAKPIEAGRIQNWQPVTADKQYVFESTVGEKVLLRVETEDPEEGEYESLFPNKSLNRKRHFDEDLSKQSNRNFSPRGGRGNDRGRGRGGRGRTGGGRGGGRGRGGGESRIDLDIPQVEQALVPKRRYYLRSLRRKGNGPLSNQGIVEY